MNFDIPEMMDDEELKRMYAQKMEEMLANRQGEIPTMEPEEADEDKLEALRGLAGDYDYSDMGLGQQPTEDEIAPDMIEEAPVGNPIMEDDKLANIEKLKKLLGK